MESIKTIGAKINLKGREWELLFTVSVIDDIQVHFDIHINEIATVLDPNSRDFYKNIAYLLFVLINEQIEIENETSGKEQKPIELKEIKRAVTSQNVYAYSSVILEAFAGSFKKSNKDPNAMSELAAI